MKQILMTLLLVMSTLSMAEVAIESKQKIELSQDMSQAKKLLKLTLATKCDQSKLMNKCQKAQMQKLRKDFKARVEKSLMANPNEQLSSEIGDGGWNFEGDEMTIEDSLFLIVLDEIFAADIDADINEIIEAVITL